jgi:hypothetical protein
MKNGRDLWAGLHNDVNEYVIVADLGAIDRNAGLKKAWQRRALRRAVRLQ